MKLPLRSSFPESLEIDVNKPLAGISLLLVVVSLSFWISYSGGRIEPNDARPADEFPLQSRSGAGGGVGAELIRGDIAQAKPVELPVVQREPFVDDDIPKGFLPQDKLEKEDVDRMRIVNSALRRAGFAQIPAGFVISEEDIPVLRGWVDAAEKAVDRSERKLHGIQRAALAPKLLNLKQQVMAGVVEGLPLRTQGNPAEPLEPFEAVSVSLYDGKEYVVRVSPREAPEILPVAHEFERQVRLRAEEFDTNVRSLFRPR